MPITVSMIVLGTQLVVPVVHLAGEHRWYAKLRQLADMPPDGSVGPLAALGWFFTQAIGADGLRLMGRKRHCVRRDDRTRSARFVPRGQNLQAMQ